MSHDSSTRRSPYWPLLAGRSVIAAVVGALVTFSPNHTPFFGLVVLGALAIAMGVLGVVVSRGFSSAPLVARTLLLSESAWIAIGLVAVMAALAGGGLVLLVIVIAVFAAVSVVSHLALARARVSRAPSVGDHRVLAVVSGLLLVGAVVAHDNSVVVVGILGAWAAVTAVYSLITAFTLKWENDRGTDQVVNL